MAKVEGKETVEVEAPEEGGKLIDLMAALEASVNAAKASREASSEKPVSVSDAKAAKAAKATKSTAAAKAKAAAERGRGARQAGTEAQDGLIRAQADLCSAGRNESVAEAALRADVSRGVRRVPELVPKPPDIDADVVDLVDVLATPDLGQQGSVLEDVAGISDEVIEQLVLGRGQVQPFPAKTRLLLREVDLQIA